MWGNKNPQPNTGNKGMGIVQDSMFGLATIVAIITAFLMSGIIDQYTAPWIHKFMLNSYRDEDLAAFGTLVWDGLATFAVYYIAKIFYVLALIFIVTRVAFTFI